jgi:hypothetical protein
LGTALPIRPQRAYYSSARLVRRIRQTERALQREPDVNAMCYNEQTAGSGPGASARVSSPLRYLRFGMNAAPNFGEMIEFGMLVDTKTPKLIKSKKCPKYHSEKDFWRGSVGCMLAAAAPRPGGPTTKPPRLARRSRGIPIDGIRGRIGKSGLAVELD